MKEFLDIAKNYTYVQYTEKRSEDWIEVPEGADTLTKSGDTLYFWSKAKNTTWVDGEGWCFCDNSRLCTLDSYLNDSGVSIVWQRHTQPEELPFMDSLPDFKHDFVNHPKHYCDHPSGIECIEITRHHDFAIGNAIKYLWRAGLKDSDNEIQDLKKAVWYIQDKISQLENK